MDIIDDRVIVLDNTKLPVEVANTMINSFDIDTTSGVITVTLLNGTKMTWDLNIEKIPISLSMTEEAVLVLTTADGKTYTADLKNLIDTYIFIDTETIAFSMASNPDGKHITAEVKSGSITEDKLQPNFLSDVKMEVAKATSQANKSEEQALLSQSYAVGGSNARPGEATDNSKYYSEQAEKYMNAAQMASELSVPQFYIDFSTGCLMSKTEAKGIEFRVENGYFIGKPIKSA